LQHRTLGVTRRGKFLVLMCRDEIHWPALSHVRFVASCADPCCAGSSSCETLQQRPRGQHDPIAPNLHPSSRRICRSHVAAQSQLRSHNAFPLDARCRTADSTHRGHAPRSIHRILKRHVQNQSVIGLPKQASSSQHHTQSGRHATRTWHDSHAATPKRHDQVSTNGRFA